MLVRRSALACLALVAGGSGVVVPPPTIDGVCASAEFREAFLEGQQGIIIDDARPSSALIESGSRVLPCLKSIAASGGATFGITGCAESSCKTWALWAIRLVGDRDARSFLVQYLSTSTEPRFLITSIQAVGSLRETAGRPALLRLLHHDDPEVRVRSIVALGAIHHRQDIVAMIEATKSLPEEMMAGAVHGFRIMGAESAISTLQSVADGLQASDARVRLQRELDSWKSAIAAKERIVATLRTGTGPDLIKALREVQEPVASDVREAVLSLLDHEDPHVRAESIVAAAKAHRSSEVEQLLQLTLALPEAYVPIAARGLELLNDPRAIEPLQRYAVGMKNDTRKRELLALVDRLRRSSGATKANQVKRSGLD